MVAMRVTVLADLAGDRGGGGVVGKSVRVITVLVAFDGIFNIDDDRLAFGLRFVKIRLRGCLLNGRQLVCADTRCRWRRYRISCIL
jgi:hypothetical protein